MTLLPTLIACLCISAIHAGTIPDVQTATTTNDTINIASFKKIAGSNDEERYDVCPEGDEAAKRCQSRTQGYFSEAMKGGTETPDDAKNIMCCIIAHGYDCMVHTAIPFCDTDDRATLRQANTAFFRDTPKMFGQSCDGYKFGQNRKLPSSCEGIVSEPIASETMPCDANDCEDPDEDSNGGGGPPLAAIIVPILVVLALVVLIGFFMAHRNRQRRQREQQSSSSVSYHNNRS